MSPNLGLPNYGKGPVGAFLQKLDHDKTISNEVYSNIKKETFAPIGGKGTLMRDFRVDEEPGMGSVFDLRLAQKGQASGQL
jgi:hypothetical protein